MIGWLRREIMWFIWEKKKIKREIWWVLNEERKFVLFGWVWRKRKRKRKIIINAIILFKYGIGSCVISFIGKKKERKGENPNPNPAVATPSCKPPPSPQPPSVRADRLHQVRRLRRLKSRCRHSRTVRKRQPSRGAHHARQRSVSHRLRLQSFAANRVVRLAVATSSPSSSLVLSVNEPSAGVTRVNLTTAAWAVRATCASCASNRPQVSSRAARALFCWVVPRVYPSGATRESLAESTSQSLPPAELPVGFPPPVKPVELPSFF